MNKFLSIIKSISQFLALPLLSGILVGTSYIPFNGWALLFCYLPLWFQISKILDGNKKISHIFWSAWFTQFILTLIGFNWIYYVSIEFGYLHPVLATGALLAFAAFMHLYIPAALSFGAILIKRFQISDSLSRFLILAVNMLLFERFWPSIFEWNLGYNFLWMKWPIFQWADTVGFWGLSAWLLVLQAFIAQSVKLFFTDKKRGGLSLVTTLAVFAALNLTGYYKGLRWKNTDATVHIGVAQGNIGNAEKLQSEKKSQYHSYILDVYSSLTDRLVQNQKVDLMIWPETALPYALDKEFHTGGMQNRTLSAVNRWQIPVITGGYSINRKEKNHLNETSIRNSVFYLSPQFDFSAPPYYKTNLLAFGEYLPFGETFPVLYKYLTFVGAFAKGSGPVVAEVQLKDTPVKLGPQICYDSLAPDFSRELAKNGAQIIFNVTNDAWFGWWAEPYQHQFMTLARAVEVRRPLVRSTNTGFSSAILADGTLLENSPINEAWAHSFEIKYKKNPKETLYSRFGYLDWTLWFALLIFLIVTNRKSENV